MKNLTQLLTFEYQGRQVPVARNEFDAQVEPPFIVFISDSPALFGADNIVFHHWEQYRVELYTTKKEGALERMIEERLTSHKIYYSKFGDIKVPDENLWMTVYEI